MANSLTGLKIVITREQQQAVEFGQKIEQAGGIPVFCPVLKIIPNQDFVLLDRQLRELQRIQWVVLTSPNAVEVFFHRVAELEIKEFSARIAAVGERTASLIREKGFSVQLVPQSYSANALVEAFSQIGIMGEKILFPCSSRARDELETGLTALGATVHRISIYSVEPNVDLPVTDLKAILNGKVDCITLFSPSALDAFVQLFGFSFVQDLMNQKIPFAAMGETTARAIQKMFSFSEPIVPSTSTQDGLITAIYNHYSN